MTDGATFELEDEQQLLAGSLDRLLAQGWAGMRAPVTTLPQLMSSSLWGSLADLGLFGIGIGESWGGTGGGARSLMVAAEAIGKHLVPVPLACSIAAPAWLLQQVPRSSDHDALLSGLAAGKLVIALALQERAARYDLTRITTTARPEGAGYALTGEKHFVADAPAASHLIVSARIARNSGACETALFLLDRAANGLTVVSHDTFEGTSLAAISLDRVLLSGTALLATGAPAEALIAGAADLARFLMAAETLGGCEAALATTLEYLKTREQFGRKLATFQALRHRASDLHTEIEMLRSLVLGAAMALESGEPREAHAAILAAKATAAEVGDLVGREAIQMHGAIGMTRELGIGRYFMRFNVLARLLGDADACREEFLATELERYA